MVVETPIRVTLFGSGCGTVGRAVASDSGDLPFETQQHSICPLSNAEKNDNKDKEAGIGPFKKHFSKSNFFCYRCDSAAKCKWSEHKQEDEIDEKTLKVRYFKFLVN